MDKILTITRTLDGSMSLSLDIAKGLAERMELGRAVVIAKHPSNLLASVRKQWFEVMRQLEIERAKTLDKEVVASHTETIKAMRALQFTATMTPEDAAADVYFMTVEQFMDFDPACRAIYIATPTDEKVIHTIGKLMPVPGVVVVYKIEHSW